MDNQIDRSRIHVLLNALNILANKEWGFEGDFDLKIEATSLVKEVDDLGYRILSIYSLEQEDLKQLPAASDEQNKTLSAWMEQTFKDNLTEKDIFKIRADIRNIEKEIMHAYAIRRDQHLFNLINHSDRLIVWNESPGHPMNQFAEKHRKHCILKLRTEYESILWSFKINNENAKDESGIMLLFMQDRLVLLAKLHLDLIKVCLPGASLDHGFTSFNRIFQIINTYLLQAMELKDPAVFSKTIFWSMVDRVKWEVGNLRKM